MNDNLFQNDHIIGNSLIGFEFGGVFKDDEDVILEKLKNILNREIMYSNVDSKLIEPTDLKAILIKDGTYYTVKTPRYNYFEAIYVLPKVFDFLKTLKDIKNSYIYFNIGFNPDFCKVEHLNLVKFILDFNEDIIIKNIGINQKSDIIRLKNIKPKSYECSQETVQKQIEAMKFNNDEDSKKYGIDFTNTSLGFITFRYVEEINYRNKWEDIMKSLNHTIITLYNSSKFVELTDDNNKELEKINKEFADFEKAFRCYELFHEQYKGITITSDLNDDKSVIDVIFPTIKEKLFNIVVCNGIHSAKINYDTDISKLQIKDIILKGCFNLSGVDIVDSEIQNSTIKDCDIYDTKITNSYFIRCNFFGYGDGKDSKFKDCFISRNVELVDCDVYGKLGKMGGTMKGGSIKNTTVLTDTAELNDKVEKVNINEMA